MEELFNEKHKEMLSFLQTVLWNHTDDGNRVYDWENIYSQLSAHAIAPLAAPCMSRFSIPDDIKTTWKKAIYAQIQGYYRIESIQKELENIFSSASLGVVVLKGTSAAQYYPHPEYRTMGDIDLLAKPEDYQQVHQLMVEHGWVDVTGEEEDKTGRHRTLVKGSGHVELHHYFSSNVNKLECARFMDRVLFSNIKCGQMQLDDADNGLVLLAHIKQHMESGIGLRQIIDWMMFVDRCLDDSLWESKFKGYACGSGLKRLAIITTRMCQKYLGLKTEERNWCKSADEKTCDELMLYILECGSFGRSRTKWESGAVTKIPSFTQPLKFFAYLQDHGLRTWPAVKKHTWLKPFAWIYQIIRYIKMMHKDHIGLNKINDIYNEKNKRNELFDSLGLR